MGETRLVERYTAASPETRRMVDRLLEQDADDQAWAQQLGPVYRQTDVAQLLGKTPQAVSADHHLLKLQLRDGQIGYPTFQFDGRRLLPGVREVVDVLTPVVATSWTVASWLTSPQPTLDGHRPVDLLRDGQTARIVDEARRVAKAQAA